MIGPTPGPWRYARNLMGYIFFIVPESFQGAWAKDVLIAEVEKEDDARLIVAAVNSHADLLDALNHTLKALELAIRVAVFDLYDSYEERNRAVDDHSAVRHARAAIAKAESAYGQSSASETAPESVGSPKTGEGESR